MIHTLCRLSELVEGQGKLVELAGEAIAVFKVGGDVFAVDNACPHRDGPLAFGDVKGCMVYCPLHAWPFDLRSGQCPDIPSARVRTFPVRIDGDEVKVEL